MLSGAAWGTRHGQALPVGRDPDAGDRWPVTLRVLRTDECRWLLCSGPLSTCAHPLILRVSPSRTCITWFLIPSRSTSSTAHSTHTALPPPLPWAPSRVFPHRHVLTCLPFSPCSFLLPDCLFPCGPLANSACPQDVASLPWLHGRS